MVKINVKRKSVENFLEENFPSLPFSTYLKILRLLEVENVLEKGLQEQDFIVQNVAPKTKKRKERVYLSDKDREQVVKDFEVIKDYKALAKKYNVSHNTIRTIVWADKQSSELFL